MYVCAAQVISRSGSWPWTTSTWGNTLRSRLTYVNATHGTHHSGTSAAASTMYGPSIGGAWHAFRGRCQRLTWLTQFRTWIDQIRRKSSTQITTMWIIGEAVLTLTISNGSECSRCIWVWCRWVYIMELYGANEMKTNTKNKIPKLTQIT